MSRCYSFVVFTAPRGLAKVLTPAVGLCGGCVLAAGRVFALAAHRSGLDVFRLVRGMCFGPGRCVSV